MPQATEDELVGKSIQCVHCAGHGLVTVWSFGVKEPDECKDCGGSGRNWQYPRGAIARYFGGPLIGRASTKEQQP
jgi:RecJ-like exonuclease